jgi:hypothetical protein
VLSSKQTNSPVMLRSRYRHMMMVVVLEHTPLLLSMTLEILKMYRQQPLLFCSVDVVPIGSVDAG